MLSVHMRLTNNIHTYLCSPPQSMSQTPARTPRRSSRLTRSKKMDDYVPPPSPPDPNPPTSEDLDATQSDEEIAKACEGAEFEVGFVRLDL